MITSRLRTANAPWRHLIPKSKPYPFKGSKWCADDFVHPRPAPPDSADHWRIALVEESGEFKAYVRQFIADANTSNTTGVMADCTKQAARAMVMSREQAEWAAANLFHYTLYAGLYQQMRHFVAEPSETAARLAKRASSADCRHCMHFIQDKTGMKRQCCFCGAIFDTNVSRQRHGSYLQVAVLK